MMPDPLTTQLATDAWKAIDGAVRSGLAYPAPYGPPHPALADAVILSTQQTSPVAAWGGSNVTEVGNGPCRVRESDQVSDLMFRYPLSYEDLRSPSEEKIRNWASAVRERELTYALTRYADVATMCCFARPDDLFRVDPGGWGQRRCVVFRSAASPPKTFPDNWPHAHLDRTVKLDIKTPRDGVDALVFRVAGGPYVRRPADFSLSWMPTADYGIELILTERLEFVGTDSPNSIIGVRMA